MVQPATVSAVAGAHPQFASSPIQVLDRIVANAGSDRMRLGFVANVCTRINVCGGESRAVPIPENQQRHACRLWDGLTADAEHHLTIIARAVGRR